MLNFKLVFCILFMLCYQLVLAQNVQEKGSVIGVVKDEATNEIIDFAAVSLYSKDTTIAFRNFMTDIEGKFLFTDLPYGIYKIKVSFIGYQSKLVNDININSEMNDVNLSDVKLQPSKTNFLQEVVVTANKPLVEFGSDTITFNVEQSIYAEGSTATDLLKSVPMVNIDIEGKPSIAGKVNTRIFIDGKPSDFTSSTISDLLSVLPSEAISKIEVITNPDVKYSADGDGIINIVLKKGYKLGLTGGVNLTYGSLGGYNTTLYGSYSKDKFSFTNNYAFKHDISGNNSSLYRVNYNSSNNISSYNNQFSNGENNTDGHNFKSAINWDITPKQNIRASINYNTNDFSGNSHLDDYRLNNAAEQTQLRLQDNGNLNSNHAFTFNTDYTLKFKKKNESLTLGFLYFNSDATRKRNLERLYHLANGTTSNQFKQFRNNNISEDRIDFNADFNKSVGKLGGLNLGAQITKGGNSNDQLVSQYDFQNQQDTIVNSLSSLFDYVEHIYAVYGSYRYRTKSRWSFKAGIRSEYTSLDFEKSPITINAPSSYNNIFPNISVYKSIKKKYNIGLSYSMRVTRPKENALNPLIDDSNQSNVSFGNPNLKASYTNQYQFSFSTAGLKWSVTPRISYATTDNVIERYRISPDSVTFGNLGSNKALTFSFFGNYNPTKKISLSGGYTLSHRSYTSKSDLRLPSKGFSNRVNFTVSGQLPYKVALEGQLNYSSNAVAQGKTSTSVTTSFGFRKTFYKNKLTTRFAATDPFSDRHWQEHTEALTNGGNYYLQDRNSITKTRNYTVTVGYRFSNSKQQAAKQKIDKLTEPKPVKKTIKK